MADLNFTISPNIILGAYASFRLGLAAKNWGNRYMVIVDPILKEIAKLDTIFNSLTTPKSYFILASLSLFMLILTFLKFVCNAYFKFSNQ